MKCTTLQNPSSVESRVYLDDALGKHYTPSHDNTVILKNYGSRWEPCALTLALTLAIPKWGSCTLSVF